MLCGVPSSTTAPSAEKGDGLQKRTIAPITLKLRSWRGWVCRVIVNVIVRGWLRFPLHRDFSGGTDGGKARVGHEGDGEDQKGLYRPAGAHTRPGLRLGSRTYRISDLPFRSFTPTIGRRTPSRRRHNVLGVMRAAAHLSIVYVQCVASCLGFRATI